LSSSDGVSDERSPDAPRLASWLRDTVDPSVSDVRISKLSGGNSSGAWRIDLATSSGPTSLVLKTSGDAGLVFAGNAGREGRIVDAAGRAGAPVPTVVAVDDTGEILGCPGYLMELIDARPLPDDTPASLHGDGWFRDEPDDVQRRVWESFIGALARLHRAEPPTLDVAGHGPNGVADVLAYWCDSLVDAAPADRVPRQLAVLDWLSANIPDDADGRPALCMGDARPGNALLVDGEVRGLVDFEVAYLGNPAADIGYCLVSDQFTRLLSDRPATGIPAGQETWALWEAATGRVAGNRDYWTAFGATIFCVTGTRAMLHWGFPLESVEDDNIVVPAWESLIERAAN
jgi:aminoglycoside phosphotransferase (APT) family kinase protein